jgi:hypothetical protein
MTYKRYIKFVGAHHTAYYGTNNGKVWHRINTLNHWVSKFHINKYPDLIKRNGREVSEDEIKKVLFMENI